MNIPSSDSNLDMKETCDDGFLKEITRDGEVIPASVIPNNIIGLIDAPIFMNINLTESPTSKCFKKSNRENQPRKVSCMLCWVSCGFFQHVLFWCLLKQSKIVSFFLKKNRSHYAANLSKSLES